MELLCEIGPFVVLLRPAMRGEEWRNILVVRISGNAKKHRYHIGFNGERFSDSSEFRALAAVYPNVISEIERMMKTRDLP